MMEERYWVPAGVDISVPSMARAYDYLLGGGHNFAVDRELANKAEQAVPGSRQIAQLNRRFLARAVRFLIDCGVRQFLDLGSGIPTVGNVHEIARRAAPESRVLYVDKDPIAVAHSELILAGNDSAAAIEADLRDPAAIIDSPQARRLLNFDEPIATLMVMVLHWVPNDEDPYGLLDQYRRALASGSYLVISHVTADQRPTEIQGAAEVIEQAKSPDLLNYRSHAEIQRFFTGFDLVEPGLVGCGIWQPTGDDGFTDDSEFNAHIYAGVGRKP